MFQAIHKTDVNQWGQKAAGYFTGRESSLKNTRVNMEAVMQAQD